MTPAALPASADDNCLETNPRRHLVGHNMNRSDFLRGDYAAWMRYCASGQTSTAYQTYLLERNYLRAKYALNGGDWRTA